ncbi:MAG: hypothetical protein ACJAZO_004420 [Myxococcota bacterium]|jgi:hypothetical protein
MMQNMYKTFLLSSVTALGLVGCAEPLPIRVAVESTESVSSHESSVDHPASVSTQWWLAHGTLQIQLGEVVADASITAGTLRTHADGTILGRAEVVLGSWRSDDEPDLGIALTTRVWDTRRDVYLHVDFSADEPGTLVATWAGPSEPVSLEMSYTLKNGELTLDKTPLVADQILSASQLTVLAPWLGDVPVSVSGRARMTMDPSTAESGSRVGARGAPAGRLAISTTPLANAPSFRTEPSRFDEPGGVHPSKIIGEQSREQIVLDP